LTFGVVSGTGKLNKYTLYVDGKQHGSPTDVKAGENVINVTIESGKTYRVVVSDTAGATGEDTWKVD
jgi:predicted RNA-binding protein with TRAM domain